MCLCACDILNTTNLDNTFAACGLELLSSTPLWDRARAAIDWTTSPEPPWNSLLEMDEPMSLPFEEMDEPTMVDVQPLDVAGRPADAQRSNAQSPLLGVLAIGAIACAITASLCADVVLECERVYGVLCACATVSTHSHTSRG